MFDLITGKAVHAPRNQTVPILVSIGVHVSVLGTLLAATLLVVGNPIPAAPRMMEAFIAAPPPPPPPAAPAPPKQRAVEARPVATGGAPIEAPRTIEPEAPVAAVGDDEEGVPGGVIGGVPFGVLAGVVGGEVAPPPVPPPPSVRNPVRVGGDLKPPELLRRVEPEYPPVAVHAHITGTVILEASVNEDGAVEDVRVLRSIKVLDQAAMNAVRQWQYLPLILNGRPTPFVLTVVLEFSLK